MDLVSISCSYSMGSAVLGTCNYLGFFRDKSELIHSNLMTGFWILQKDLCPEM